MKRPWIAFAIICILAGTSLAQSPQKVGIKSHGVTALSLTISGVRVSASITTSLASVSNQGQEIHNSANLRCTFSRVPCSLVDSLEINVADHALYVPRSLQVRLSDVGTATLGRQHGQMVLTISGGDASESYSTEIYFNKEAVTEMLWYDNEDPTHPIEITKYFPTSFK